MRTGSHVQLPQKCDLCPIQHRSVCAAAGGRIRSELNRISHRRTFSAGETIVGEADEAGIVGNVVRGVLRMVRTMADGRQQIVGLLFPSDMFGRVFASHSRYAIEAATTSNCAASTAAPSRRYSSPIPTSSTKSC